MQRRAASADAEPTGSLRRPTPLPLSSGTLSFAYAFSAEHQSTRFDSMPFFMGRAFP